MTACVTGWPRCDSAVSFIFCSVKAEICDGEYAKAAAAKHGAPAGAAPATTSPRAPVSKGPSTKTAAKAGHARLAGIY
ncbi:hypothetical protein [Methylobacterium oryzae]|uniref:hypothetical protein n=1 Tax=Methylobacterium oryzae TaxID=334852 RepID=UPI002F357017